MHIKAQDETAGSFQLVISVPFASHTNTDTRTHTHTHVLPKQVDHALESLVKSMKWDEDVSVSVLCFKNACSNCCDARQRLSG